MTSIVLTRSVSEYRATIPALVEPSDAVLEVGCAWGTTSAMLTERCRRLVAVDKSDSIRRARTTYPAVDFHRADAFDVRSLLPMGPFSVVYMDLSGSRSPEPVIKLARRYRAAFAPRLIVIKNTRLKQFIGECVPWGEGNTTVIDAKTPVRLAPCLQAWRPTEATE